MSEKVNDGGPAFPWGGDVRGGMSLRDWFAGQAIDGIIHATSAGQHMPLVKDGEHIRYAMARDAYDMADAMLAARGSNSDE